MNQRDELFQHLLDGEGIEWPSRHILTSRDKEESPEDLSFTEERFWFLDQFEHAHPIYNGCKAVQLFGHLDIESLIDSVKLVVRRHEILRTTYPAPDGSPIPKLVDHPIEIPIQQRDPMLAFEPHQFIKTLAQTEWLQPIDMSSEMPIRARLVRIDAEQYLFLLTLHQIAGDSQSVAIFFRELWSAYAAKVNGKEPELPILTVQYRDYARWQRKRVTGQDFQRQRSYWMQQLSDPRAVLNLPADFARPQVQHFDGARLPVFLPAELQTQLKTLSQNFSVTLFMTLLAAFKTLLHRYTFQDDLLIGCPMINRRLPETEYLLGSFMNTLVLRTSYSGSPSFRGVLRRVKNTCLGAFAHDDFPFEKLVEELQPTRDLGRNPIFQVMFAFQNTSVPVVELADLRCEFIDVDGGMTKFDLTISLFDKENGIGGFIEYSTDLFNRDRIERMAGHYQTLLEAIVADPGQCIATLPILTEAETHQILVEWNDTAADYPKDKCIHQLFEAQVERTPDAIALEFENNQITYRELNRRANQLAHYLISLGVGPEKLVGICVERSIEMVVGLLGILKAGGAYVPLDPTYPTERLRFMIEDSSVSVLVTQVTLVENGGWMIDNGDQRSPKRDPLSSILDPQLTVVRFDRDWPQIEEQSSANPNTRVDSANLAYVIYTSGSAGQPKGVQIEHRSVVNCLSSIGKQIGLSPGHAWLAVTTISFDIAALELYLPLITGARLIVTSREESGDSVQLLARLRTSQASVMQATPSLWKLLMETGWQSGRGFKILCGGEALSRHLADDLLKHSGSVWNLYGPTETTIWSTMAKVTAEVKPISIGRPVANTHIYILDQHLQPMPIGIPGDLYIGGDGLARGYLNRLELTAEKFIANPFSNDSNSHLYRTGDIARYHTGGNIEFLGRNDNQVKIRGHRIELGEIESVLNQHPAVKEAVVVAFDESESDSDNPKPVLSEVEGSKSGPADQNPKSLVSYVVLNPGTPSTSELRRFLQEKLPYYMIPSVFVFLDRLPLTPNGKLDRSALPPPDGARPELDHGFVEPRTEIEELIAQVWREVLKLDKIGVYDNFFELGGHSLLATRVVARLQAAFKIQLPLRKLFELPTVAGLAEHIETLRRDESAIALEPILPAPRDRNIPLSFSQQRLWFLRQLDPVSTSYNMPSSFAIHGPLNVAGLEQAINEVIARHEVLRTVFLAKDANPVQVILPSLELTLPVVELTDVHASSHMDRARTIAASEARQPFDFITGPLLRAQLLKFASEEFVLLLTADHMILDNTSLAIFYKEIAACYDAVLNDRPHQLPPLPLQYADYASWQRHQLDGDGLNAQLNYWKQQCDASELQAELATDHGRLEQQTSRGARLAKTLSPELTAELKALGRREGVTLFMTLLAAFDVIIARHTGCENVVVGSTIAGRNRPELENLIGFFINALPLSVDLSGRPSFSELLKRVREVCLDAYTHQELPFERIVQAVNPERALDRNPLFQVLFNVADASERTLPLSGCEVTRQVLVEPEAKFDLTLYAPEKDGAVELAIVYNVDLFSKARIGGLLDEYAHLLRQIAAEPANSIDEYDLLAPETKASLPNPIEPLDDAWHGAIHALFSRHAAITPDRVAVTDSLGEWTYEELDRASNRLANYLIANDVKPKDRVAICAHRDASLTVALMAVLKAGGVFIILDPVYPAARLVSYLQIARPSGWLQLQAAGEPTADVVQYLESSEVHCRLLVPRAKDEFASALQQFSDAAPNVALGPSDPAYIALTSGSTGEPKGVLSRHGPITHFLPWQNENFDLHDTDRFALLSGLAYNHLHRDVFTPLSMGASLFVPPAEIAREPHALCDWLREQAVTVLHLTPALGELLLTAGKNTLPAVRRLFFGGDTLTRRQVARVRELAPNATIGSFYGATETQRAVGYYEIVRDFEFNEADANLTVPLGRGIADVQLLVMNKNGKQAGIGEIGELYVRSPHLAEDYFKDDANTREAFITNPFTNNPEDRLYKTGELARYLPDGNVEWAGRTDRRVNIRGFRVALEEIELALKQHPTVKDAAVILREFEIADPENTSPQTRDSKREQRLAAYVATDEEGQSLADMLHSYLSTRLPDYMIPNHFVTLEKLPLSPNGKVDYSALPPIEASESPVTSSYQEPQNDLERKLCAIFAQVLGREPIGVNDNFFRIGGHSLLAAQVAVRIGETLGVTFELRSFLKAPTVAALAIDVASRVQGGAAASITDDTEREEIEI